MKIQSIVVLLLLLIYGCLSKYSGRFEALATISNSTINVEFTAHSRYGFAFVSIGNSTLTNETLNFGFSLVRDQILETHYYPFDSPRNVIAAPRLITWQNGLIVRNSSYLQGIWKGVTYHLVLNRSILAEVMPISTNLTVWIGMNEFVIPRDGLSIPSLDESVQIIVPISETNTSKIYRWQERLEFLHISIWIISLVYYTISMILLVLFSQKQPLKSRGILPICSCILHIFVILGGMQQFFDFETAHQFNIIFDIIKYPFTFCMAFIGYINYLRYIIIFNMNQRKAIFIKNKGEQKESRQLRYILMFFKYIGHWISLLIIIFLVFVLSVGVCFFVYYVIPPAFRVAYVAYIVYISDGIIIMLTFVYDLWMSFSYQGKACFSKFLKNDVYWYRYESLFGIVFVLPWMVFGLAATVLLDVTLYWRYIFSCALNTLLYTSVYSFQTGLVLHLTIILWLRDLLCRRYKKDAEENVSDLTKLMADPETMDLFQEYSKSEFSEENLSAYIDLIKFSSETNAETRKVMAERIVDLYLSGAKSALELNIHTEVAQIPVKKMAEGNYEPEIFKEVIDVVLGNLSDTYGRFKYSGAYNDYKRRSSFIAESFGNNK